MPSRQATAGRHALVDAALSRGSATSRIFSLTRYLVLMLEVLSPQRDTTVRLAPRRSVRQGA